jgi:sRNA-binding protein
MKKGDVVKAKIFCKVVECVILEVTKKHVKVQFGDLQVIVRLDKIVK